MNIPTVWVAIVIQLVGMLFFAGSGWNRLSTVETTLDRTVNRIAPLEASHITLTSRSTTIESNLLSVISRLEKYDEVKERLVRLELSLTALTASLDKIGAKLEGALSPRPRVSPSPRD